MSALGHKRTYTYSAKRHVRFTPKADICSAAWDVRFGPIADIASLIDDFVGAGEQRR